MIASIRRFLDGFRPSPLEIAARELVQAQIDLLAHEAHREHFTGTVETLQVRIERLRARVADLSGEQQ